MSRVWIALRAMFYAALFLALWTCAALMCRPLDRFHLPTMPAWLFAPGAVIVAAGVALTLTTVVFFIVKGWGTPAVFDPPKRFVPHGPYRLVRNPMYFGYVLLLVGLGLCFTSTAMLVFAGIAFLLIHTFVVSAEEPGLRRRFGREYEDYCEHVPRWVPRFLRERHPPQ